MAASGDLGALVVVLWRTARRRSGAPGSSGRSRCAAVLATTAGAGDRGRAERELAADFGDRRPARWCSARRRSGRWPARGAHGVTVARPSAPPPCSPPPPPRPRTTTARRSRWRWCSPRTSSSPPPLALACANGHSRDRRGPRRRPGRARRRPRRRPPAGARRRGGARRAGVQRGRSR